MRASCETEGWHPSIQVQLDLAHRHFGGPVARRQQSLSSRSDRQLLPPHPVLERGLNIQPCRYNRDPADRFTGRGR